MLIYIAAQDECLIRKLSRIEFKRFFSELSSLDWLQKLITMSRIDIIKLSFNSMPYHQYWNLSNTQKFFWKYLKIKVFNLKGLSNLSLSTCFVLSENPSWVAAATCAFCYGVHFISSIYLFTFVESTSVNNKVNFKVLFVRNKYRLQTIRTFFKSIHHM